MMVLALLLAVLTFAGVVRVWHVFTLAALLGVANAFDIPARQSFVIQMVGREDLPNAIALNASMVNGARLIGPAVAGAVVAMVGEAWCFLINGTSYIGVISALLLMKTPHTRTVGRATVSAWESVVEGFAFAWHTRPVRALLILLGLVSFMGMPYTVLMPIFADRILLGGPHAYGFLMSSAGLGALAGSGVLTLRRDLHGLGRWIALSAIGFGVCLILFSLSRSLWLSAALLAPAGFFMILGMAASNTLVQAMVPDPARTGDGGVFDDVHGDGADGVAHGRLAGCTTRRTGNGGARRSRVSGRRRRLRRQAAGAPRTGEDAHRRSAGLGRCAA